MKRERWIWPYLRQHVGRFTVIITLGVLTVACASALMFTSGYLISEAALRPENILMVYVPIVLVRTFGIGRAVIHYVERLVGHDAVLRILAHMRGRLYRLLEPQALFIRSRYRTGEVLSALADDIEQLQDVYLRTVFPTVVAVVIYVASVAALGWFDLPFALLMALYVFIIVVILPAVSLWLVHAKQRQWKRHRNKLYRQLTDAVLGMGDWLISGRAPQFIRSYEAAEEKVATVERPFRRWAHWRTFIAQGIVGMTVITIVYWAGQQYADGELSVSLIAAFALVVFPLMDAFLPVADAVEKIPQYEDSVKRIHRMQGVESTAAPDDVVSKDTLRAATKRAHIQLQQVYYRYEDSAEWSVDGISLQIPQGKKIALLGRSGAGKSTLLKLVQGVIVPERGQATINGVPANQFGDDISRIVAVLNQRPHLFDTTVANNIRLGKPDATDEAIRSKARQVKLHTLIESLPKGYDTPMLETGQRFSGGERQRIALARILLQDTPVVILDEPTVGLDPRTERDLLGTIFRSLAGKTLLWITHHLVGVEHVDEVVFIEDGRIVMQGAHTDLLVNEPRYHRLYELDRPVRM